jgi:hypothetical protein
MPKQPSLTERSLHSSSSCPTCPAQPESEPPPVLLTPAPRPRWDWKTAVKYSMALLLTGALGFSSGTFFLHVYNQFLLQRQQAETEALLRARAYEQRGNFDRCIETAELLPTHPESMLIAQECQGKLDRGKLQQATELAEQGQFAAAITLAKEITSPEVFEQAQTFILSRSQRMLELMEEAYLLGKMDAAAHIARAIDSDNPLYEQVQARFQAMQYEWMQQQNYLKTAQTFLESDHLNEAIEALQMVTHPHWQEQVQPIRDKIYARRAALENVVSQVKFALSDGDPEGAIALLNSLPPTEPWLSEKTALYKEASTLRRRQIFHQTLAWIVVFLIMVLLLGLR